MALFFSLLVTAAKIMHFILSGKLSHNSPLFKEILGPEHWFLASEAFNDHVSSKPQRWI